MNSAKTHLTTKQLAERWGLNPVTLSNWRTQGRGPSFIRIGSKIMYPERLIIEMESDLRRSTSDPGSRVMKTRTRK